MKILSAKAQLSKVYTNHSIRATTITVLDENGFKARHIQVISGHKCKASVRSYAKKCPDSKKRQMREVLSRVVKPSKAPKPTPVATVSTRQT